MELLTYVFKDGTVETTLAKAKTRGEDYKIKLVPYEKPFKATPKREACLVKAGVVRKF
jgi:hypothetical protein